MQRVYDLVVECAPRTPHGSSVGHSGTARRWSLRPSRAGTPPQAALPSAQLRRVPPNLMESELFGHERGSFTAPSSSTAATSSALGRNALPRRDTEMPLVHQVKLLRVLETGRSRVGGDSMIEVDVRVIAASNRSPKPLQGREVPRGPALTSERVSPSAAALRGGTGTSTSWPTISLLS